MKRFAAMMLLGALLLGAGEKPVGVWCGYTGQRLTELMRKTVLNPQWSADKPKQKDFTGKDDFNSCSAVIFMLGFGKVVWRDWKPAQIAAAEKYVENGGTLIVLFDGGTNPGGETKAFARLLGAKNWSEFTGKAEFAEDWKECGVIPQVHEHMLSGKKQYGALKDLTTAKMLIGNESGALAAENRLGKGRVLFMNVRLSESFTPYVQPYNRHANAALEQLFPFARKIHEFVMSAKPALSAEKRERWDWKPLGPAPDKAAWKKPAVRDVKSARKYEKLEGAELKLVENGEPKALIILGTQVGDRGGANVLNNLLRKMSGATLPTVVEKAIKPVNGKWQWRGKLYDCRIVFAAAAKNEIRAEGNTIRIGSPNPVQGTYTFLREALGYRILWPGKAGEVYTVGKNVSVKPFALTDAPFFQQRYIRNGLSARPRPWKAPDGKTIQLAVPLPLLERGNLIGFDPREAAVLRKGNGSPWFAAQRLGGSLPSVGGGSFGSWQKRYGKDHPEYFALQFDSTRQVRSHNIRICKTNPDVIKLAADEARALLKQKPNVRYYSLSPSDGGYDIFCMCPRCRAWDPSGGREVTHRVFLGRTRPVFRYPRLTDRVLRFTSEVARELRKTHPDVKVRYLAYSSYFSPPEYYRAVPDNMTVTFVGLQYLSRSGLEYDRKVWDFWAGVSSELILRPNYLLGGAGLPVIYVHEMAKDIRHCAETGMIGSDFDSLTHHWATLGLNYYVLAQLLWDPTLDVDAVIDDYCQKGFGPAAPELKAYFALCEKLTGKMADRRAENVKALEDLTNDHRESLMGTFMKVYTQEKLTELAGLLARAREKTAEGSPERARVDFIDAGFRFTMNRVEFCRKYSAAPDKRTLRPLAEEQSKFWHAIFAEYPYAVNVPQLAIDQYYSFWRNCGRWKAEPLK